MIGFSVLAGGPGRQVGVVVQLGRGHGLVDVAVQEFDQDLGAFARQMVRAPIGTGLRARNAQPGAGTVVARRIAGVVAMAAVRQATR
jgi:hypothetical protein